MAIPWQEHLIPADAVDLSTYVEEESRIRATTNYMEPIGPSIWLVRRPQNKHQDEEDSHPNRFCALANSMRSTSSEANSTTTAATIVVALQGGGGAFVWNPQVSWTRELDIEIQARCGVVKHLVVPNKHYMTPKLKEWSKANPQAKVYAPLPPT
jgi:hypothetical protein